MTKRHCMYCGSKNVSPRESEGITEAYPYPFKCNNCGLDLLDEEYIGGMRKPICSQSREKQTLEFTIEAQKIMTKPRMTRRDRWKKRPVVERWNAWKDLVWVAYKNAGGRMYHHPVAIYYGFYLSNKRKIDLDNLIKGINDSLIGIAYNDDSAKIVRRYDGAYVLYIPKNCIETARIKIRPLLGE